MKPRTLIRESSDVFVFDKGIVFLLMFILFLLDLVILEGLNFLNRGVSAVMKLA